MTKLSIIISVYNAEKYLERCLESVINQTFKDIEIICVNDGSTDLSSEILKKYASEDKRITIVNQKNAGPGVARNTGMQAASGDFLTFLDSDDWLDLNFYEKLYNAAIETDSEIAVGNFVRKNDKKHKIRLKFKEQKVYKNIEEKMVVCNVPREACVWNKIYKKSFLDENNLIFPERRYYEDGLFTLRALFLSKNLVCVPGAYYYYYINPTSIVKVKTDKKELDRNRVKYEIIEFARKNKLKLKSNFMFIRTEIKILNILVLTISENLKNRTYALFGVLPVFKICLL